MPYLPIFLDLSDQNVVVVGGGEVAERKIKNLLAYGCKIYVTSPHLTPYLTHLVAKKEIYRIPHESLDRFLDNAFMVIAATNDPEVNTQSASRAKKRAILVNVVDRPGDCNFIVPSIVKRGDLQIAISTGAKSPALARKIRHELDARYGPEYGVFVELLGLLRRQLLSQRRAQSRNKGIFQQLVDSNLLELIRERKWDEVRATLRSILGEDFPIEYAVDRTSGRI
jgi:precorrin-2 dehydrogenase/sirohydrochlorin ferrochelatase